MEHETKLSASGFLWKLGGGAASGTAYNRRYFALFGSTLVYSEREMLRDMGGVIGNVSGTVSLRNCAIVARDGTKPSGKLVIEISHPGGDVLVLAADSPSDRARWLDKLKVAAATPAQHMPPGAPPPPPPLASGPAASAPAPNGDDAAHAAVARAREMLATAQRLHADQLAACHTAEARLASAKAGLQLRRALFHARARGLRQAFDVLIAAKAHVEEPVQHEPEESESLDVS